MWPVFLCNQTIVFPPSSTFSSTLRLNWDNLYQSTMMPRWRWGITVETTALGINQFIALDFLHPAPMLLGRLTYPCPFLDPGIDESFLLSPEELTWWLTCSSNLQKYIFRSSVNISTPLQFLLLNNHIMHSLWRQLFSVDVWSEL